MIEEVFMPFEMAKLLKKRGFDEQTFWQYDIHTEERCHEPYDMWMANSEVDENYLISCPTLQMAMMWLREKKGIYINVRMVKNDDFKSPEHIHFIAEVYDIKTGNFMDNDWYELTYEDVAFSALNYVLCYCLMEPGETASSLLNEQW